MSISEQITRLQNLRSGIRTKLIAWGVLSNASATLSDCKDAIDAIVNNGAVAGSISTKAGAYTVPAGYHNGSGSVAISSAEQAKIIAANIKSGVNILGVTGSYAGEGVELQEKSVTPSTSAQVVSPDAGYDGLSAVNVGAIPDSYADVSGVTAAAADVLANTLIVGSDGAQIAGEMVNNGAISQSINGTTVTSYAIPAGFHNGSGTVSLDSTIETALAAI